jgi:hypothetical protein
MPLTAGENIACMSAGGEQSWTRRVAKAQEEKFVPETMGGTDWLK